MMGSSETTEEQFTQKEVEEILHKFDNKLMDVMIDKAQLKKIKNSINSFITIKNSNFYQ